MLSVTYTIERRAKSINGGEISIANADKLFYRALVQNHKLFGLTIWRRVIGREYEPRHVWIAMLCHGFYAGQWESAFEFLGIPK